MTGIDAEMQIISHEMQISSRDSKIHNSAGTTLRADKGLLQVETTAVGTADVGALDGVDGSSSEQRAIKSARHVQYRTGHVVFP